MAAPEQLRRLQQQFMRAMTPGSQVLDTIGFRVFVWPSGDLFYRNVAVPVAEPHDWGDAIRRMQDVFALMRRLPRLEFFEELWPRLPAALERAGYVREMRAPAMVLTEAGLTRTHSEEVGAADAGPPATFLGAMSPDALLQAFLDFQTGIFQGPGRTMEPAELPRLRTALRRGETMAAVILTEGRPVAAGSLVGLGAEAELAGVATRPDRRRAGLAERVCHSLLERFFATGGELAWLSAGGAGSDVLYRKLGFVTVGTQLNYGLPPAR